MDTTEQLSVFMKNLMQHVKMFVLYLMHNRSQKNLLEREYIYRYNLTFRKIDVIEDAMG